MTTYNGAKYLRNQLDSILYQTIPASEIVVCDDCSTDDTWNILCMYAQKYPIFKIFKNEKNMGFIRNFEKAIHLCSGDYIALSDQDDIWLPNHLQLLINGLGNKYLAVGDAELIDSCGDRLGYKLSYCENLDFIPKDDTDKAYFILFYRNPYQGASMLFRRDFLEKVLPIPNGVQCHDVWFSLLACFYGGCQPLKETVTLYRRHDKAVTGYKVRKSRFRALAGHFLISRIDHRPIMLLALKERLDNLTEKQKQVLSEAEKYYTRKKTFIGRLTNLFYDLKHYKLIFGTQNTIFKYRHFSSIVQPIDNNGYK